MGPSIDRSDVLDMVHHLGDGRLGQVGVDEDWVEPREAAT